MGYDRLLGVLVAQQKVVVEADALAGEDGMTKADAGAGSNPVSISLWPYKNILDGASAAKKQR
jgi:hypothetical protein